MKPDEINKAIAEACGIKIIGGFGDQLCQVDPDNQFNVITVPNFSGSLDAMAEARKTLNDHERILYVASLHDCCKPNPSVANWHIVDATAAEHAEAFLRAKGLWKD